jgi:hypothetical protein
MMALYEFRVVADSAAHACYVADKQNPIENTTRQSAPSHR